jgi:hypothetical protein
MDTLSAADFAVLPLMRHIEARSLHSDRDRRPRSSVYVVPTSNTAPVALLLGTGRGGSHWGTGRTTNTRPRQPEDHGTSLPSLRCRWSALAPDV